MGKDDYNKVDGDAMEEPDPLTRQQINQCIMDIEDMHPIAGLAKYYHIVPCLRPLRSCKKSQPNFDHALRESILIDMGIEMPQNDKEVVEDPFMLLGYGINSFFDLMYSLFWFAIFVTIFMMPLMYQFSKNYSGLIKENRYIFNQFSLGNMGGTTISCTQHLLQDKKFTSTCYDGLMSADKAKFGVLNEKLDKQTYCRDEAIWFKNDKDVVTNCTNYMKEASDSTSIQSQLLKCQDKASCKLDISDIWVQGTPASVFADGCSKTASNFYLQVPCEIAADNVDNRDKIQIMGLTIVLFVFFFSVLYIDYIDNQQALSFIDWDVKTITAGDYTIEFDIINETYERWQATYYDETNPMSENAQFKLYVQNYLEQVINDRIPDQGTDGDDEEAKSAKKNIAQITCAYENAALIKLMTQRGKLIGSEKWTELKEINGKISDELKNQKFTDDMQTPVSLFVTFETEEGHARAVEYNSQPQAKFLGQPIEVQEASEPTDIIWENRQLTEQTRLFRKIIVLTFIGVLLSGSGASIYFMRVKSDSLKNKYPPTSCNQADDTFLGNPRFTGDTFANGLKAWEHTAVKEFITNQNLTKHGKKTNYGTTMQCFCRYQKDQKKPIDGDFEAANGQKEKICSFYFSDKNISKFMGICIAIFIVVINMILQIVIIKLVDWIGEDTHSQQLETITKLVFIAQFFNTGLLLLLINANVTEHQPKFITGALNQDYYDYVPMWYSGVGYQILQTMIINAIKPPIMLIVGWAIPALKRWLDRQRTSDRYITKKTSMAAYKALYSGADYKVQVQYSQILNVACITMLYGAQMPLLFPIAACTFIINYICQRFTVAYYVKLPAALDDRLTKLCVGILSTGCYLFLINGFWAYMNLQIFTAGAYHFIDTSDQFMKSGHLVSFNILWIIFGVLALVVVQIFKGMMSAKKMDVDEDLPNFYHSITLEQADMIVQEEEHCQKQFGILVNDPDTVERLDATEVPEKAIQGTPWYTVLSNQYYMEAFGYIGAYVEEREKLIEDGFADVKNAAGEMSAEDIQKRCEQSDMVFLLLNLSVIPDEVVKQCNFQEHGWSDKFKLQMEQYKQDWTGNGQWRYQCAELEENYAAFVKSKEAEDEGFKADHQEYLKEMNEHNEREAANAPAIEMNAIN